MSLQIARRESRELVLAKPPPWPFQVDGRRPFNSVLQFCQACHECPCNSHRLFLSRMGAEAVHALQHSKKPVTTENRNLNTPRLNRLRLRLNFFTFQARSSLESVMYPLKGRINILQPMVKPDLFFDKSRRLQFHAAAIAHWNKNSNKTTHRRCYICWVFFPTSGNILDSNPHLIAFTDW